MSLSVLTPLVLFVFVSLISPGGATALATASGANFGFRGSVPLITGIATGVASMAALAAAGLAAVILTMPSLQVAMRAVGSIYLLWLAYQTARSGPPHLAKDVVRPARFIGGIGLLWINPKAWATTLSAAASFAGVANTPGQLSLLLGTCFGFFAVFSLSLWCAAGSLFARLLKTEAQWRALNIVLGLLLAASIVPIWLE